MSRPERPPSDVAPRQRWSPDAGGGGVTCPVCGLANQAGARVCRNCGLPIASAGDPLRGVAAGSVDIAKPRRSGFSATLGLVLVVALLLISGTLAVSGGGILSGGGRIGLEPGESPAASPNAGSDDGDGDEGQPVGPTQTTAPSSPVPASDLKNSFAYTCDSGAMRDLSKRRWNISRFLVGTREGFERVTFEITRRGQKAADSAVIAGLEWVDPGQARSQYGISRVAGDRAIVVTFEGSMDITANQIIDRLFLDREGVTSIRSVEMFEGQDGLVHAVVGVNGDACAKMSAPQWKNKSQGRRAKVFLDIGNPT